MTNLGTHSDISRDETVSEAESLALVAGSKTARFLAELVDELIAVGSMTVLFGIAVFGNFETTSALVNIALILSIPVMAFSLFNYFVRPGLRKYNGQTIGHQQNGIKIVKRDGSPVTMGTVLLRNVVYKIIIPIALGELLLKLIGIDPSLIQFLFYISIYWGTNLNLMTWDYMAKTRVVCVE